MTTFRKRGTLSWVDAGRLHNPPVYEQVVRNLGYDPLPLTLVDMLYGSEMDVVRCNLVYRPGLKP